MHIPLYKPQLDYQDRESLLSAFDGNHIIGNGEISKTFQNRLASYLGVKHAFFVTSGTSALELAFMTIGSNQNVVLPDFTFTSVPNSVIRENSVPYLIDIEKNYFNIDTELLSKTNMEEISVILPVHYAGMPVNIESLLEMKNDGKLIIEDAAHAIGSTFKNKKLGTFGDFGCFSFHASKNLSIGEGGAIVTNNSNLAEKLEIHLEKGTNRSSFFRGEIDKYGWVDKGSSFVQSDLLASIGISQLKKLDKNNMKRSEVTKIYNEGFESLQDKGLIRLPIIAENTEPNWHIYAILTQTPKLQLKLIDFYNKMGIGGIFHYSPLSSFKISKKYCKIIGKLSSSINISSRLIRLPIYPSLTDQEIEYIIYQTKQFFNG
jgi:dTDP-4-amino-4,6-dideoxygalactose transaminase